jgi:hypothetical protein
MSRRFLVLFSSLVLLAAPRAEAQRRPAVDTARAVVTFSDVLSGRGEYAIVVLAGRTAYRVEITPGTAILSIRPARLGMRQPAVTRGMEEAAFTGGGVTYLVVPAESAEYRLEVAAGEPVRVRVIRDPREQALLEHRARSALGTMSFGVRAIRMNGTIDLANGTTDGADGMEICLGIATGLVPFSRRLGGCAFMYDRLDLAGGLRIDLYGLAPRYALLRTGPLDIGVAASASIGKLVNRPFTGRSTTYHAFGVGLSARLTVVRHVDLEVEPGISRLTREGYDLATSQTVPSEGHTLTRLTAGVHLRL